MRNDVALLPHQHRVVIELKELTRKRDDLLAFLENPIFKEMEIQDQNLLIIQLETMDSYIVILETRIDRFYEINSKENLPKAFFLSVNGNEYTRIDLEKAYESWNKEFEENPENFEPNFDNTTGADSVNALIMYLEKTKIPEFPKDKIG